MIREFGTVWQHRDRLIDGVVNTIWLSAVSLLIALVLGACLSAALMSRRRSLQLPARTFVDFMRCVPFLLLAYVVYYGLPTLGLRFDNISAGIASLALYNSAYLGEILRAAWSNLPREYTEAGHAFGFHGAKLFFRIILPPLIFSATPIIGNQVIQIVKDSAFLTIIAVPELTHEASAIQSMYYVPFGAFVAAVALYWMICRCVEFIVRRTEILAEERR